MIQDLEVKMLNTNMENVMENIEIIGTSNDNGIYTVHVKIIKGIDKIIQYITLKGEA